MKRRCVRPPTATVRSDVTRTMQAPPTGGEAVGGSYPQVGAEQGYMNFLERRKGEVHRIYPLGTRAELCRRCRVRRNPGTSVERSIPEDRPTPPAMPCDHLQHTDARAEALGR